MEKKKTPLIPLDHIRGLIIEQGGRCAISGVPLDPMKVNADHIIPLSRQELSPSYDKDNVWLVDKTINAMKGSLSYDEFIELCKRILNYHEYSKQLLEKIKRNEISTVKKEVFEAWIVENCTDDGIVKL